MGTGEGLAVPVQPGSVQRARHLVKPAKGLVQGLGGLECLPCCCVSCESPHPPTLVSNVMGAFLQFGPKPRT